MKKEEISVREIIHGQPGIEDLRRRKEMIICHHAYYSVCSLQMELKNESS